MISVNFVVVFIYFFFVPVGRLEPERPVKQMAKARGDCERKIRKGRSFRCRKPLNSQNVKLMKVAMNRCKTVGVVIK